MAQAQERMSGVLDPGCGLWAVVWVAGARGEWAGALGVAAGGAGAQSSQPLRDVP